VAIKKYKIEYDECRSLESLVDQLQSVVDGLRSRALTIAHGDRRLLFLLEPDSPLELGIHAERSGNRERLQISLEWRRQHLHIGAAAQPGAPAEAGNPVEEGLEPEELEEGEALDDDDWEDQAETLRQGNNRLAQALQQSSLEH